LPKREREHLWRHCSVALMSCALAPARLRMAEAAEPSS
jgi:hypothetical protein